MNKIIFTLVLLAFVFSSCSKEEDIGCKTCTAVMIQESNNVVLSITEIDTAEYCDEALELIMENPTQVINHEYYGLVIESFTVTYTCE